MADNIEVVFSADRVVGTDVGADDGFLVIDGTSQNIAERFDIM
jgi:hypothetical protein